MILKKFMRKPHVYGTLHTSKMLISQIFTQKKLLKKKSFFSSFYILCLLVDVLNLSWLISSTFVNQNCSKWCAKKKNLIKLIFSSWFDSNRLTTSVNEIFVRKKIWLNEKTTQLQARKKSMSSLRMRNAASVKNRWAFKVDISIIFFFCISNCCHQVWGEIQIHSKHESRSNHHDMFKTEIELLSLPTSYSTMCRTYNICSSHRHSSGYFSVPFSYTCC